jgi:hypothetical protein
MVSPAAAEAMRQAHPLRLQYELFADSKPFAAPVAAAAEWARANRSPAKSNNPFLAVQQGMSRQIVAGLDTWRDLRDRFGELMFLSLYGSPLLQAAVGVDAAGTAPLRKAGKNPLHRQLLNARIAELKAHISEGGLCECVIRGLLYVGMARRGADERGLAAIRQIRRADPGMTRLTLGEFKTMVREQYFMLLIDPEAALAAIPALLPDDADERRKGFAAMRQVLAASGEIVGDAAERLERVARLFCLDEPEKTPLPFRRAEDEPRAKAS